MNITKSYKNNLIILISIKLDMDSSVSLSRMIEYAKAIISFQNKIVYITSLKYDNKEFKTNSLFNFDQLKIVGVNTKSKRNYFAERYFGIRERKKEFNYILNHFKGQEKETTFLYYPGSFATFWEEVYYIKKAKSVGFSVYAERNERSLGIILNNQRPSGILNKIVFTLIQIFEICNSAIKDEISRLYKGNIIISSNFEKWIQSKNINYLKIPVLANQALIPNNYCEETYYNIGFSGSFSFKKDGLDKVIYAVSLLINKYNFTDIRLNITGFGDQSSICKINKLIDKNKIRKFTSFNKELSYSNYLKFQSEQNLMVAIRGKNLQGKYSFATKIAEYFKMGKLLLTTNVSDNAIYIKDGINGFILNNPNPEEIAEKIIEIKNLPIDKINEIRSNAISTAETDFNIETYAKDLLIFLELNNPI